MSKSIVLGNIQYNGRQFLFHGISRFDVKEDEIQMFLAKKVPKASIAKILDVSLSLLCDHLLLLLPIQSARFKNKKPGMSVDCLVEHINAAALINGVSHIVYADEPKKEFDKFKLLLEESLLDRSSTKHMSGLYLGRMEPTPSLIYKKAAD